MTWLVEDPLPLLSIVAIVTAFLGLGWYNTGQKQLLWGMFGAVLVGGLIWLIEWLVITDRERIELTLQRAADALANNDAAGVLGCISPSAAGLRAQAQSVMTARRFSSVKVGSNLKITIEPKTPGRAVATFIGNVTLAPAESGQPDIGRDQFVGRVEVIVEQTGDDWLVTQYRLIGPGDSK